MKKNFYHQLRATLLLVFLGVAVGNASGQVQDVINRNATATYISTISPNEYGEFSLTLESGTQYSQYRINSKGTQNTYKALKWDSQCWLYMEHSVGIIESVSIVGTAGARVYLFSSTTPYTEETGVPERNEGALELTVKEGDGVTKTFTSDEAFKYICLKGWDDCDIEKITVTYRTLNPDVVPEPVLIEYNQTSGSVPYTILNSLPTNYEFHVASITDWLTVTSVTDNEISFTSQVNTTKSARTATIQMTYSYGMEVIVEGQAHSYEYTQHVIKTVKVKQKGDPSGYDIISSIQAAGTYDVKGTIVAKNQNCFIVGDGTGYVYCNKGTDFAIGDKVELAGPVNAADYLYQFTDETAIAASTESLYKAEEPVVLTGSALDARVGSTYPQLSTYVQYVGVLSNNGTAYVVTDIDGAKGKCLISNPLNTEMESLNALVGKTVKVKGYYVGISYLESYYTLIESIKEATPALSACDVQLAYNAKSGSIYYNLENPVSTNADFEVSRVGDWLTLVDFGDGTVSFTTTVNDTYEARTATVTLTYRYPGGEATNEVTKTVTVTQDALPDPLSVTLNSYGYATFCSTYPLDFRNATDHTAWVVTGVSGETIQFEQIRGTIKGKQGLLLMGEPGATISVKIATESDYFPVNRLVGFTAPAKVGYDVIPGNEQYTPSNPATRKYYGLSGNTFVKVNAGTVPAGKALLPESYVETGSGVKSLTFDFGGTAIENIPTETAEGVIYDLAGRRVEKATKGIYIMNGKKMLVK